MDNFELLREVRDGWLDSARGDVLEPGRFLERDDIKSLGQSTGWTGLHLAEAVRRAFSPFDDQAIRSMCPDLPDTGSRPALLAVLAGRLPALGAKVVFHALCAGMDVILKPSAMEPVFVGLLARSVCRAGLEGAVSVAPSDREAIASLLGTVPACIVYGSDDTVARINASRRGLFTLSGHHMESVAVVFASSLGSIADASDVAAKIATDTAIYDQSGCLSPVAVIVQDQGAVKPLKFAELLLQALVTSPFEPGLATVEQMAAVRMFEREASLAGGIDSVIRGSRACPPLVVMCDSVRPGPGMRTLQVATFPGPGHVPVLAGLMPHLRGRIQGMAVAGTRAEMDAMVKSNPDFVPFYACEPGRLQDPPARWPENGIVLFDELRKMKAQIWNS